MGTSFDTIIGAGTVFEIRNEIIKYLHEHHDYKVFLFESGIGEQVYLNWKKESLNPAQLTSGLMGPWRNKSFRDLMEFTKKEELEFAGFDVQRTGLSFKRCLKEGQNKQLLDTLHLL